MPWNFYFYFYIIHFSFSRTCDIHTTRERAHTECKEEKSFKFTFLSLNVFQSPTLSKRTLSLCLCVWWIKIIKKQSKRHKVTYTFIHSTTAAALSTSCHSNSTILHLLSLRSRGFCLLVIVTLFSQLTLNKRWRRRQICWFIFIAYESQHIIMARS